MITPEFDIVQDDDFVFVTIRVPHVKVSEMEFYVIDEEFKFYCKPYFLRLLFPHPLVEDGREGATYDPDSGKIRVALPKLNPGENFPNLDMLTSLLAKPKRQMRPVIEVLSHNNDSRLDGGGSSDAINDEDWTVDQTFPPPTDFGILSVSYGFNRHHSNFFCHLGMELCEILDNPEPDHLSEMDRRLQRLEKEVEDFDVEHYLADFMMQEEVKGLLCFTPWWSKLDSPMEFSDEEKDHLRRLPNKEFLIENVKELVLGLVDILAAYCYDHRTTFGEPTVESPWTICKLSGLLSWLEVYKGIKDPLLTVATRSLIYPLYRHWDLALQMISDALTVMSLGRRAILRCLLAVRNMVQYHETRYFMNELFITDYCIWIQTADDDILGNYIGELRQIVLNKDDVPWDLLGLEAAALEDAREQGLFV